jgi:hypothetical protein
LPPPFCSATAANGFDCPLFLCIFVKWSMDQGEREPRFVTWRAVFNTSPIGRLKSIIKK